MEYNWHREVVDKATKRISAHARKFIEEGIDLEGWLGWFRGNHPKVFEKYEKIPLRLNRARDNMSEFKKIAKEYQDTEIWALNQFVEHLKREKERALQAQRESKKDPQEVLV